MSNNSTESCPQCGASLPPNAPGGLCPACLMAMNMASQTDLGEEDTPRDPKTPTPEELGKFFPHLELLECLGRGGMGVVYKARQPRLNRYVALKILAPEREKDPAFAERFEKEARALARMNHPNIVTVHDFGETEKIYYLLMELVDGVNLRQLLQSRRLAPREALAIVPQICDALQYAHDNGIVHRDIKPENILLDRRGCVKVADFGLAKIVEAWNAIQEQPEHGKEPSSAVSAQSSEGGKVLGTPQYMSPEQIEAPGSVDHRADIYALGGVFYQMLTGSMPDKRLTPPSTRVHVDVRLDQVVLRALEKDPTLRYQQVSELKTELDTITSSRADADHGAENANADEDVRSSAKDEDDRISSAANSSQANVPEVTRFSRSAIVGAAWASAFFIALFLLYFNVVNPPSEGPTWWQLRFTLLPLGVTAPFGATVLGLVSIGQICHSGGRLYGLPLALVDALLFPLLLLNAGITWLANLLREPMADYLMPLLGREGFDAAWIAVIVLLCLGASVGIIRWAWRTATNATGPQNPTASSAKPDAPLQPNRKRRAFVALLAIIVGLASWLLWAQRPQPVDQPVLVVDSPDGKYTATSQTFVAVRLFGPDRVFSRFKVEQNENNVSEHWDVRVPVEKIAGRDTSLPMDKLTFAENGQIAWSDDSKRVSLRMNTVEFFALAITEGQIRPVTSELDSRPSASRPDRDHSKEPLPGEGPEEVVDLSDREVTDGMIAGLAEKKRLKRLSLEDSSVHDDQLQELTGLPNLEWVNLSATLETTTHKPNITNAGLKHIAQWKRLSTLKLHGLPITDEGLKHLWKLPDLQALQLGGTQVTGNGLVGLEDLSWLRLDATPVTDDDLSHLSKLNNLEQLYLDRTEITDAGLEHLTGLRHLHVLNLHGTKVTADGIAALKKAIPSVTIGSDFEAQGVNHSGQYELTWSDGVSFKIIGGVRNPRKSKDWFHPDGTPFKSPPAEIVAIQPSNAVGKPAPEFSPKDEVLVYYRIHTPVGTHVARKRLGWNPRTIDLRGAPSPTVRDRGNGERYHTVSYFALRKPQSSVASIDLEVNLIATTAEWEPVAVYDGEETRELLGSVMAVFSPPRYDEEANRHLIDVMHNISREDHDLRLVAKLKNGERKTVAFHSGVISGTPTKGFAHIHGNEFDVDEVREYVLQRTPWLQGTIKDVAVRMAK